MSTADRARAGRRRIGAGRDEGAVTAEVAVALPAVLMLLAALLVLTSAAAAQLRCADGARTGARVAALGLSDAEVTAVARRVAPAAEVVVHRSGPWVEVVLRADVAGSWFTGGRLAVSASATAWQEP